MTNNNENVQFDVTYCRSCEQDNVLLRERSTYVLYQCEKCKTKYRDSK